MGNAFFLEPPEDNLGGDPSPYFNSDNNGYKNELEDWRDFIAKLNSLRDAASILMRPYTFNIVSTRSSNPSKVKTASQSNAIPGTYDICVYQLAQSQKIISGSFTTGSKPLILTGSFAVNGCYVSIVPVDSLNDIAVKINNTAANLRASVMHLGPNDFRMVLSTIYQGKNAIISLSSISDDNILIKLGFIVESPPLIRDITKHIIEEDHTTTAASLGFSDIHTPVQNLIKPGLAKAISGIVRINGIDVEIDLSQDSLFAITEKLNKAHIHDFNAAIANTLDPFRPYALSFTVYGSELSFLDSNSVLEVLGIVQRPYVTKPIQIGQDAVLTVNGNEYAIPSNTIINLIEGLTLTLCFVTKQDEPPVRIQVEYNTANTIQSIKRFIKAYNDVSAYKAIGRSDEFISEIGHALTSGSGQFFMPEIGLTFAQEQKTLQLDEAKLHNALINDINKVITLFGLQLRTDNDKITAVRGNLKTLESPPDGYPVHISQIATQPYVVANTAQTKPNPSVENISLQGSILSTPVHIRLHKGNTITDSINQINSNKYLREKIVADIDPRTGCLLLKSVRYGSRIFFSVHSDLEPSDDNSGIGRSLYSHPGIDAAGTINGEEATGNGRTLTGNPGNYRTEALQIIVTATEPGDYGNVIVSHGFADRIYQSISRLLDNKGGCGTGSENCIQDAGDTEQQIIKMHDQLEAYMEYLHEMVSAMDGRVQKLLNQVELVKKRKGLHRVHLG